MDTITHVQALELIDIAAMEDRLYHYNGGQAYIRVSMMAEVLMIIDHTSVNNPVIGLYDGAKYFETYENLRLEQSARIRDHGSLAMWYVDTYLVKAGV